MDLRIDFTGLFCFLLIYFSTTTVFVHCEARRSRQSQNSLGLQEVKHPHGSSQFKVSKRLDSYLSSDLDYVGSPYSLPPFDGIMGPASSPDVNPPYCVYPPLFPLPPSTPLPTPITPIQPSPPPPPSLLPPISPAPPFLTPNPPEYPTPPSPPEAAPTPPSGIVPGPPSGIVPGPPSGIVPGPPAYGVSPPVPTPPPSIVPSPPEFVPGPPIFLPPVVYPPPTGPPPSPGLARGLWCVAKPTVPDPIMQEAMNYACGSGADCDSIQPSGSCYQPDTLISHASFAFNSYWQRTKVAGGTCDFGGTAMLVTKDPSYDGCRFTIY